jgi:hypothetical protein
MERKKETIYINKRNIKYKISLKMKALQQPLQWCWTCNHCNEDKVVELEGDGIQSKPLRKPFYFEHESTHKNFKDDKHLHKS